MRTQVLLYWAALAPACLCLLLQQESEMGEVISFVYLRVGVTFSPGTFAFWGVCLRKFWKVHWYFHSHKAVAPLCPHRAVCPVWNSGPRKAQDWAFGGKQKPKLVLLPQPLVLWHKILSPSNSDNELWILLFMLDNSFKNLSSLLVSIVSSDNDFKYTVFFSTGSSIPCIPNAFLVSLTIFLYVASYSRFPFPFTISLSWSILCGFFLN